MGKGKVQSWNPTLQRKVGNVSRPRTAENIRDNPPSPPPGVVERRLSGESPTGDGLRGLRRSKMQQNLCILILGLVQVTKALDGQRGDCEMNAWLDFAGKNPPVLLAETTTGGYELAQPTIRKDHDIYVNLKKRRILIACPGHRNSLNLNTNTTTMEAEASCKYTGGHNYFNIGGKEYQTDRVQCNKRVTPSEKMTQQTCNDDGALFNLGYTIENAFYDLIQVCHRLVDGKTHYARHILDGSSLPRARHAPKRPDEQKRPNFTFHNKALYRGFPPYKHFKAEVQKKLMTLVTGDPDVFDHKHDKFFAKGHLSPNADFPMSAWRDVTFLFVNVQPQWQEVNGGNWNNIEMAVRQHACETGEKYEIITGVKGVLTLNDTKLYLDSERQRLPIPEYYFKVVREMKTKKCMTFIANNFPLKQPPESMCEDECIQYNWPNLKDYKKEGYVQCCSYEWLRTGFLKTFPQIECSGGTLRKHPGKHQW